MLLNLTDMQLYHQVTVSFCLLLLSILTHCRLLTVHSTALTCIPHLKYHCINTHPNIKNCLKSYYTSLKPGT